MCVLPMKLEKSANLYYVTARKENGGSKRREAKVPEKEMQCREIWIFFKRSEKTREKGRGFLRSVYYTQE